MKNFSQSQNRILSEIYRCINYFHRTSITDNLILLALPSQVKCISEFNLITPSYGLERKGCHNWYKLTEKGIEFFSNYVEKQRLSNSINLTIFDGSYTKKFNKSLL